ncbi:MAG: thioredoxin-disulfide reductase [Firmicutes bacterium]|nr:thioredoxin-disulfide reductase [Bacillota bacterium]MCL5038657.1 thioredoxin-disulfide reductase [Bacillota bacterium]
MSKITDLEFVLPSGEEEKKREDQVYDVIIVGGGPAGLTAALYAGRSLLSTLLLEKMLPGGQAATTDRIENYPGFPGGISGADLMQRMEEQAREFGVEIGSGEVTRLEVDNGIFKLYTDEGISLGRTVILASGARERKLGVPGEEEYRGRGVSYCATCDGAFYKGKQVVVVGGGDSAVEEGLYLTRFAGKVTLIHRRDQLRAVKTAQERAFANPKMAFVWDTVVEEIMGTRMVENLRLKNVKTGQISELAADGVFIYAGMEPNSEFLQGLVEMDSSGYVISDENMATSLPGVFAAGDLRKKSLRQVSTAVGDGATAAMAAERYLSERHNR